MRSYTVRTEARTTRTYLVQADTLTAAQNKLEEYLHGGIRARGKDIVFDDVEEGDEEVIR